MGVNSSMSCMGLLITKTGLKSNEASGTLVGVGQRPLTNPAFSGVRHQFFLGAKAILTVIPNLHLLLAPIPPPLRIAFADFPGTSKGRAWRRG